MNVTSHQYSGFPEPSTLNPQLFDVVIIGSGIAGPCAALALARRGMRVALLEAGEFPRHKVCGEFLSPESQAIFTRLGVREVIQQALPTPITRSRIVSHTGSAVEISLPVQGLALSRFQLDQILWEAASDAGVHGYARTRVRHVEGNFASGFTITTNRATLHSHCVIAASGRHSSWQSDSEDHNPTTPPPRQLTYRSHQHVGLKAHFNDVDIEPGVVELYGWRGGYCGVVGVEDGITNVCLLARYDILKNEGQRAPEALWDWLLQECPPLARRMAGATQRMPWLATGNIGFGKITPATGDILHCGDASGFIDPLTGDGMAMAARSAELAAAIITAYLRSDLTSADVAPLYTAAWQREFGKRLRWAAALQPLLMSPLLTTPAVTILSRMPRLAQRAVANTRGAL